MPTSGFLNASHPSFSEVKTAALISSAALAGGIAAASYLGAAPLYLAEPRTKVRQFTVLYKRGAGLAPFVGAGVNLLFIYLGVTFRYSLPYTSERNWRSNLFFLASALTISIVPYTLLVMKSTNNALFAKAAAWDDKKFPEAVLGETEDREVNALLDRWVVLNYVRAGLAAAGTLVGAAASRI